MSETLTGEKSSEQIAHVHEEGSKKAVSVSNFASVEADRAPRYVITLIFLRNHF